MAEREGFEPSIEFPLYTLSKRAPSTTRPSLRKRARASSLQFNKRSLPRLHVQRPFQPEHQQRLGGNANRVPLRDDLRSCPCTGARSGPDRRSLASAGNRPDDRAQRRAAARKLGGPFVLPDP